MNDKTELPYPQDIVTLTEEEIYAIKNAEWDTLRQGTPQPTIKTRVVNKRRAKNKVARKARARNRR